LARPAAEVKALYAVSVPAWSDVADEGEATGLIEALVRRAEAMEFLGDVDAARSDWTAVVRAGYRRLWVSDAWVVATERLKVIGGELD